MNPINFFDSEDPELKNMPESERFAFAIIQGLMYVMCFLAVVLVFALFSGCSTPRAVEEHHHHVYQADTMAVRQQVDRQLSSWHEEMTQFFTERLEEYRSEMSSSEHQQETISETVTVSLDSLGREIRTEQRTISRDVTREMQQQEQRITQEYEARLQTAVDSLNDTWQTRYDSLASHVAQMDSTLTKKTPVGDTRPWYQRLWDRLNEVLIIAIIFAVVWLTRRLWK